MMTEEGMGMGERTADHDNQILIIYIRSWSQKNLYYVSINLSLQVFLSPEVISQLHTTTPAIFVSQHYSDFETQVTPVKQGPRYMCMNTIHIVNSRFFISFSPNDYNLVKGAGLETGIGPLGK